MKKIITLALLVLGLTFSMPASSQVKFGVKGGLNVTDLHVGNVSSNFDKSNRAGWFIGPTIKVSLPLTGLSIDASALYDQKSSKMSVDDAEGTSEQTVKQQSVDIPINLRYGVGLGSTASIFLFAGPQWAFNVGDKNFKWDEQNSYSLRSTNFSVNVGLGVTVLRHLQLTANYNIACGKTADLTFWDAAKNATRKNKSRSNAWQIGLAYYF